MGGLVSRLHDTSIAMFPGSLSIRQHNGIQSFIYHERNNRQTELYYGYHGAQDIARNLEGMNLQVYKLGVSYNPVRAVHQDSARL